MNMIDEYVSNACANFLTGEMFEDWNLDGLRGYFYGILTDDNDFKYDENEINKVSAESITNDLVEKAREKYEAKEKLFPEGALREIERIVLLRNVDRHWVDHIDAMDDLENGIGLRAYGQKDPVNEYRFESANMFDEMVGNVREETVKMLLAVMPASVVKHAEGPKNISEARKMTFVSLNNKDDIVINENKINRMAKYWIIWK